jgi:catabolite repression HPr-like protein
MVKKTVTVRRDAGLEARPIAILVQKASQFSSRVFIEVGTKSINAKSIMGMMSLRVGSGDQVVVVTDGVDEEAAANEIESYLVTQ